MSKRRLIVSHHAPDLDAIGASWLLKRFDSQIYADAQFAFVNPGETISLEQAEKFGCQLHEVTHVDTGLGEFDHHQPERNQPDISATSLVYDYLIKKYPDYGRDQALKKIVQFTTQVDHFQEIFWPESESLRYVFMIHELIRGHEFTDPHNDDSQMHFGLRCLDSAYATMKQRLKAEQIIQKKGQEFEIKQGKCLAVATRNDDTVKLAQKQGYVIVVRKDPEKGHIRIKVRPDAQLSLEKLHQAIIQKDQKGTWFYHASGKMLLNGSNKHLDQKPSPLTLNQVITMIKEIYG